MQQLLLSLRHCLVGFFIIWHCRAWANSLGNHAEVPSVSFLLFYLDFCLIFAIFGTSAEDTPIRKISNIIWIFTHLFVSLPRLLLIIGAFGRQSSMRCVAIISCSVSSLSSDGVTLRSGGKYNWRQVAQLFPELVHGIVRTDTSTTDF